MDRVEFMNRLVRQRGYSSYLEIGSGSGETLRSITARYKVGVDPDGEATFPLSSDAFFQENLGSSIWCLSTGFTCVNKLSAM
jgi:hypothetical protein